MPSQIGYVLQRMRADAQRATSQGAGGAMRWSKKVQRSHMGRRRSISGKAYAASGDGAGPLPTPIGPPIAGDSRSRLVAPYMVVSTDSCRRFGRTLCNPQSTMGWVPVRGPQTTSTCMWWVPVTPVAKQCRLVCDLATFCSRALLFAGRLYKVHAIQTRLLYFIYNYSSYLDIERLR